MQNKPYFIGITGGSGSGKTYFLKQLLSQFSEREICLISQDNYYKSEEQLQRDSNGVINFDIPESIDYKEFGRDLEALQAGETIQRPEYTFNNPTQTPKLLTFSPCPIIIVEGLFVFYVDKIRELIDLKLFIEAQDHIRIKRRIMRDNKERGYDLEDVLYRYEYHVMPSYERFVKPIKNFADIVIPNNKNLENALEIVVTFLKQKLHDSQ